MLRTDEAEEGGGAQDVEGGRLEERQVEQLLVLVLLRFKVRDGAVRGCTHDPIERDAAQNEHRAFPAELFEQEDCERREHEGAHPAAARGDARRQRSLLVEVVD